MPPYSVSTFDCRLMTITGPIVRAVTFGLSTATGTAIGARVPWTTCDVSCRTVAARSTRRPIFDFVTNGLKLRSTSRESTGLRSKRAASFPTNALTSRALTVARRLSVLSGAAVIAFATPVSAATRSPSRSGAMLIVVAPRSSSTGRSKDCCTAATAASAVSPPTATPPRVTPGAIVVDAVVVVGVVSVGVVGGGVSARTEAASVPDAAQATTSNSANAARLSIYSIGAKMPGTPPMIPATPLPTTVCAPATARSRPADHDDGDVVRKLAAGKASAVLRHGEGERPDRQPALLGQQRVEPLRPVLVAVAAGLDDAVGVENERPSRRQLGAHLLVRLRRVDPEHEPCGVDTAHGAVGEHQARRRVPGARARNLATDAVYREIHHRDELAGGNLVDHDVVRVREEISWLGMLARERPKHELGHGHVGGRLDAVACDVAQNHREAPVVEREEVVDVAAELDPRRRLVHLRDLEPRGVRPGLR